MEFSGHDRPTSAGDDSRLHRFPDPAPPANARDADASQGNAALVRRRDELLWELHNEHIRLDMILRELVETEYAIAARVAPAEQWPVPAIPLSRDRCRRRSPEAVRPPCSRSPEAVRPPAACPRLDRSPSPIAMSGYLEYCQWLSKQTEVLKPAVANASVRPTGSAFVRQEVTPEHKDAVGGQCKADFEEGHGEKLLFESSSRNQSTGQQKAAQTPMVDLLNEAGRHSCQHRPGDQENSAFVQRKWLEFSKSLLGSDAKQQQECRSSSKQTPLEILEPAATNGSTQLTRSISFFHETVPGSPQAVGVENSHGAQQLNEIKKNQSSGQRKVEESVKNDRVDPLKPLRSRLAGQENISCNAQKMIEFSETTPERTSSGLKRRLTEATPPIKKPKPFEEWNCSTSQLSLDKHQGGRRHQSNLEAQQAWNKPAELNTKASPGQRNSKNLAKDGEPLLREDSENAAENTGSRHLGEKPRDVYQPSFKDRLEPEPAPSRWTCSLCQARCCTEFDYYEHRRGRRHRENTEALRLELLSRSERRDGDDGVTADWDWKRAYYCDVCQVQCGSEKTLASHLSSRRHREALEAAWLE